MNPSSRQPATRRGVTALTALLLSMLPLAAQAAPAAPGSAFGGDPGSAGAAFIRIEHYPSRFEQVRSAPASQPLHRPARATLATLATIRAPLLTAGTLLHSAFVDALDPTIGLARPALLRDAGTADATRSAPYAQGFGSSPHFSQDIDGSSAFRLIDSHDRAAASSAPVLGVRIGERTSLRLQMGGMDTREEDGFSGGLRFEYVP